MMNMCAWFMDAHNQINFYYLLFINKYSYMTGHAVVYVNVKILTTIISYPLASTLYIYNVLYFFALTEYPKHRNRFIR